jgi:ribonuclease BN (tRNA processing enzyme)
MIPIHLSPRYVGQEERLRHEAREAFLSGEPATLG